MEGDRVELLEVLLTGGGYATATVYVYGRTLLCTAAHYGANKCTRLLLENHPECCTKLYLDTGMRYYMGGRRYTAEEIATFQQEYRENDCSEMLVAIATARAAVAAAADTKEARVKKGP
jgi:hypothetical protein